MHLSANTRTLLEALRKDLQELDAAAAKTHRGRGPSPEAVLERLLKTQQDYHHQLGIVDQARERINLGVLQPAAIDRPLIKKASLRVRLQHAVLVAKRYLEPETAAGEARLHQDTKAAPVVVSRARNQLVIAQVLLAGSVSAVEEDVLQQLAHQARTTRPSRSMLPWTPDEDQLLLDGATDIQGRSPSAIQARRSRLAGKGYYQHQDELTGEHLVTVPAKKRQSSRA